MGLCPVTSDISVAPLPARSSDPRGLIRALGFLKNLLVEETVLQLCLALQVCVSEVCQK